MDPYTAYTVSFDTVSKGQTTHTDRLDFILACRALLDTLVHSIAIPKKHWKSIQNLYVKVFKVLPLDSQFEPWFVSNEKRLRLLLQSNLWPANLKVHKAGSFTIHNPIDVSDDVVSSIMLSLLKIHFLAPDTLIPDFMRAAYGDVYLVNNISRNDWWAWYEDERDSIYLRGDLASDCLQTLIHEISHRYWKLFMSDKLKSDWIRYHKTQKKKAASKTLCIQTGDVFPFEVSGIHHPVVKSYSGEYLIIHDSTDSSSVLEIPMDGSTHYDIAKILRAINKTRYFPNAYAASSPEEHFCECVAYMATGSLKGLMKDEYINVISHV
jgi:hypothetical protein